MWDLLIGNGISLIASIFLAISSCARERKNIYLFQILETGTYCVSSVFFKSWSGLSTLILSLIRNILVYTKHFREWHAYLFSVLVVVVGLMVNNRGFLGPSSADCHGRTHIGELLCQKSGFHQGQPVD